MRLLLDTHVLLWSLADDPRLSGRARALISDAETVYVSAASLWEMSIKAGLGKLVVDIEAVPAAIQQSGFTSLPISFAHAVRVRALPPVHRDPFDRMLVAQALCEPLQLLSADAVLQAYSELVIPV